MTKFNPVLLMAMARERSGLLDDARALYSDVLATDGRSADVLRRLAMLELHDKKLSEGIALMAEALTLDPGDVEAQRDYAYALHHAGRNAEAFDILDRVVNATPNDVLALFLRARALQGLGQWKQAADDLKRLLEDQPENTQIRLALGTSLVNLKLHGTAASTFRAVLDREPKNVDALHYLGVAQHHDGLLLEARRSFESGLALDPNNFDIRQRYADVLFGLGDAQGAVRELLHLGEMRPETPEVWSRLGLVYAELKRLDDAVANYERALDLRPDDGVTLNNIGLAKIFLGRIEEAVVHFNRVLEIIPISDTSAGVKSNQLFATHYLVDATPKTLLDEHLKYHRHTRFAPPASGFVHKNDRDPERPLRIGYVSHDLLHHPVGFFVGSVIMRHDPAKVISYCYSTRALEDDITWKIKASTKHWRRVVGVEPNEVAALIEADQIDILIDLSGHTAGNSLQVFVLKPAPIQASWAGYVGTTGLSTMDYIIADRFHVPPELEHNHSEAIWRMPNGYICYEPPSYAPPVGPLPVLRNGHITFGSFSNPAKINPPEIAIWARILQGVPNSTLRLRYGNMAAPGNKQRILDGFAAHGIAVDRIVVDNGGSAPTMFAAYNEIDIALDTFPYSGGLTTCEALWMGVPVVTCPGDRFASRHSFSHLSNAGLVETIARDFDDYVAIATALALDAPRLQRMRGTLRATMGSSPLCDNDRFTRDLEDGFRAMWTRWLSQTGG